MVARKNYPRKCCFLIWWRFFFCLPERIKPEKICFFGGVLFLLAKKKIGTWLLCFEPVTFFLVGRKKLGQKFWFILSKYMVQFLLHHPKKNVKGDNTSAWPYRGQSCKSGPDYKEKINYVVPMCSDIYTHLTCSNISPLC